jgi:hypothetical protein
MEIKEIISYYLNGDTNIIEVSFRTIEDEEDVLRNDTIDYTIVEEYGFDLVTESFDFFGDDEDYEGGIFEEETIQWIDEKGSIICLDDIDREYRIKYCLTDDIRFTKKNEGLLNVKRSTGLVSPKPIQNSVIKMKHSIDKNFFLPKTIKQQKVALINMDSDTESEIIEQPKINVQEKNLILQRVCLVRLQ